MLLRQQKVMWERINGKKSSFRYGGQGRPVRNDTWIKTWGMTMSQPNRHRGSTSQAGKTLQVQRSWGRVLVKFSWEQDTLNSGFSRIEVYIFLTSKYVRNNCRADMVLHKGLQDPHFHQLEVLPSLRWEACIWPKLAARVPGHHICIPGCRI